LAVPAAGARLIFPVRRVLAHYTRPEISKCPNCWICWGILIRSGKRVMGGMCDVDDDLKVDQCINVTTP